MSKTTVGYTRLSQESDRSIANQKRKIRQYCDSEPSLDLVEILNDGERTSGFDTERSEYSTLKAMIEEGEVEAVVTNDRKRIGRDFWERMDFLRLLDRHDREFHTAASGRISLEDPSEVAMESFHAAKDHESAQHLIEQSREAVEERIEAGYDHGRPPFGMEFGPEGRYWVPGENFEKALKIIDLRDEGVSLREIRERLDMEDPPSPPTISKVVERKERYLDMADE